MRCLFLADSEYEDPYGSLRTMLIKYRKAIDCDNFEEKNAQIKLLITEIGPEPSDSLRRFFLATFQAQSTENNELGYIKKHEVWTDLINFFLTEELDEESDEERKFRKELSVVACYRMYRNLNEWYEHVLITENLNLDGHWKQIKLPNLKEMNHLSEEELDKKPLSIKWRNIVFFDHGPAGRLESSEKDQPIFRKSFSEFNTLMKNEEGVFDLRNDGKESLFDWHGESLDRFLSNELSYLCTDLLYRLESKFDDADAYIKQWKHFRSKGGGSPNRPFKEYQKRTNMLVSFLKNIVKLHEDPNGNLMPSNHFRIALFDNENQLTREGERFEIFLEVAYLHALIACQLSDIEDLKGIFKKWPSPSTLTKDQARVNRRKLRTSKDPAVLGNLINKKSILNFDDLLKGKTDGMSYALLYRWLGHKSPGFYLALASNVCPGMIVGNPKLERDEGSSLWGNKIILKDTESNYHQIAQNIPREHRIEIARKLTEANRYFLSARQLRQVGEIKQNDLSFGACQFTFSNVEGKSLQSEWEDAFRPSKEDWDEMKSKRLFKAIWKYSTREMGESRGESGGVKHQYVSNMPLVNLDEVISEDMRNWFAIDQNNEFRARILDWVHGDEWGGNFTLKDKDDLYAIDLEDVLHREDGEEGSIIVGGLHAWRFIANDIDKSSIDYEYRGKIPVEAFNAYAGMGRLLAALVQKTVCEYRDRGSFKDNNERKKFIQDSIHSVWDFLSPLVRGDDDHMLGATLFQVWASFADWLSYWKSKDDKLLESDFNTAINHIKTLATGESTIQESSPE